MSKAVVSVKLEADFQQVRLVVSESANLSNPIYSGAYPTTGTIAKIEMAGLLPDKQYYYGVEINGTLQTQGRGKFRTFPSSAKSFTCAFSSCAPTGNNNTVFQDILDLNPLFFIHMGDLHYENITSNNVGLFRDAYDAVFDAPRQAALYANIPTMYMWDDHDFTNNDGDSTSPSKPAAQMAYKERVPHYPLHTFDGAIYQSWVVGRVRFIMTDLMSHKTPMTVSDTTAKTQFGETQLAWFFNELTKPEPLKIWINTKPWIGNASTEPYPNDKWWGYSAERKRIANFIKANQLQNRVVILSGDTHALAIDDGRNSDYADGGGGAIPVFQAAPLGSSGSFKGGPWQLGPFTNGTNANQYGVMNITDAGTSAPIVMEWQAKRGLTTLATWSLDVPSAPYVKPDATIDNTPPTVTASPDGGNFTSNPQTVLLSANEPATIYYTTNGSTPTTASTVYQPGVGIQITQTTTLKYFAVDSVGNASAVVTKTFTKIDLFQGLPTAGLVAHYDAKESPKTLEGNLLLQINDLSGKNHHAVSTVRRPTLDTTTFSNPVMYFAPAGAEGDELDVAAFAPGLTTAGYTIIMTAAMFYALNKSMKLVSMADSAGTMVRNVAVQGSTTNFQVMGDTNRPAFSLTDNIAPGEMGVFASVVTSTNSSVYLNGTLMNNVTVTSNAALTGVTMLRIGKDLDTGTLTPLDGYLGDVLIYNRALSAQEIVDATAYFKSKWGIA